MQFNFSIKRKLYCVLGNDYCSDVELPVNAMSPAPAASATSGCYDHDESTEVERRRFFFFFNEVERRRLRSSDLEDVDWRSECFGTAISAFNDIFRVPTPSIELCGDSQLVMLMDFSSASTEKSISPPPPSSQRKISAPSVAKAPSAAELEEFFADAEDYVRKRFAEKYNYDIVKDAPILGGRYQWFRKHFDVNVP